MQQSSRERHRDFEYYKKIFAGKRYPLAYVDLDLFDQNVQNIKKRAGNLPIRIATKSLRCIDLIHYLLKSDTQIKGVMSFCAEEAVFLSRKGIDDILVAYPETNLEAIREVATEINKGKYINLMVDHPSHIINLEQIGKEMNTVFPVCADIDVSVDFPGLHFGVWRSSIRNTENLGLLLQALESAKHVQLEGMMGYESQIAGVTDDVKGQGLMNSAKKWLKRMSYKKIAEKRQRALAEIERRNIALKFINGGGTGSVESTIEDPSVTEITVGSGFYNAHLFDNYARFRLLPAAGFACAIGRIPKKGIYTCAGGGYIASGVIEKLKAPLPMLPAGVKLTENEGAGEVQTPVLYSGTQKLEIGDPIFFRHAKAGELCERFNELYLIRKGKIENRVTTYRGDGQCFI